MFCSGEKKMISEKENKNNCSVENIWIQHFLGAIIFIRHFLGAIIFYIGLQTSIKNPSKSLK
ncbi:MAG: hypothetical protein RL045_1501 [Bacteroidota bacterium]|jgi:hypothetical protein